jgi:hypothetical protein
LLPSDLAVRVRGVLRDMSMLSEVAAVSYDGDRVQGGGSKSAPPPGVRFGTRDLRDLSLAEYWAARFVSARGDAAKLEYFLYLAQQDLARARRRIEPRDPHEPKETRELRIIDQYEGLNPLEAAVAEDCSEMIIRRIRFEYGRDGETGWPE